MGLFDDDLSGSGVAPESGSVFHVEPENIEPEWDDEEDVDPIEHNDIRSTPVAMPDFKKGRTPKLQKDLENLYTMIGTGIFPFDNQVGVVILESGQNCASSLYELAQKNPRLRKQLESMLSAGAYGAVISAHLPIAVIIATKYIPSLRENYGRMMADFKKTA
jgi:hypothetical protein